MRRRITLFIIIGVTVIVIAGVFWFLKFKNKTEQKPEVSAEIQPENRSTFQATSTTESGGQSSSTLKATKNNSSTQKWKLYSNDTYGFSFNYPADWQILSGSASGLLSLRHVFTPAVASSSSPGNMNGVCQAGFFVITKDPDTDLGSWASANYKSGSITASFELNIAGKNATEIISGGAGEFGASYYIPLTNSYVLVAPLLCGEDSLKSGEDIMSQIFSTFKFTQ